MISKYSNFAIVASFIGLWLNSFITNAQQIFVGFTLIFSFGILHGANDLALIKNVIAKNRAFKFYTILTYYILIVVIGAILFLIIPWFALTLFILVSGYHFGEQHWNEQLQLKNKSLKFIFEISYGLLILFLMFNFHALEVQKIILAITSIDISLFHLLIILKILILFFIILSVLIYMKVETFKNYIFKELFFLLVFAILFKVSSLIWGFALYFIFWHSIPSIIDQIKFLFGKVDYNNFKLYFKSAFVYWIISLIGIALLYIVLKDQKIFNALFFSFLASITFPHVVVILKMFGKK